MKNEPNPADELLNRIRKGGEQGQEIAKRARGYQDFGQFATDLSDESIHVLKYGIPSNIDLDEKLRAWEYLNDQEHNILTAFNSIKMSTATTSGSAIANAMIDFINPNNVFPSAPPDKCNDLNLHIQRLSQVIDRQANKDEVLSLLEEYNLNIKTKGLKSHSEQLNIAWEAFDKPVTPTSPASTSLIPMRECINTIIAALLRRRPEQERAKKEREKILSILSQLAGNLVSRTARDYLADRWNSLNDELSESKQKDIERQECRDILRRSTLFLRELLQSLDQNKFR